MRKQVRQALGVAVVSWLLSGCNTPRTTERLKDEALFYTAQRDGVAAASTLNALYDCHKAGEAVTVGGKPQPSGAITDKHAIVWHLERGALAVVLTQWGAALEHFTQASAMIASERSQRRGDVLKEALANETAGVYRGSPVEHVYADVQRALAYVLRAQRAEGLLRWPQSEAAAGAVEESSPADTLYQNALNVCRGLTNSVLKWAKDVDLDTVRISYRYQDDPLARWLAGAIVLAQPQRSNDDLQYAVSCFELALRAYTAQRSALNDPRFRLEAQVVPDAAKRLYLRALSAYDPERVETVAKELGFTAPADAQAPAGYGSVLIVHSVGVGARKRILDVRVVSGPTLVYQETVADRNNGVRVARYAVGNLWFWAKGPGADEADFFHGVPVPAQWLQAWAKPGTIIGFALPVFSPDVPIAQPGTLHARAMEGGVDRSQPLMVAADLDAYTRATLYDEQVSRTVATLGRVVGKQIVAQTAANAVEQEQGAVAGFFSRVAFTGAATASEVADTRCWTLAADHVNVALIDLPAGSHQLSLSHPGGDENLGQVDVQAGRLVVIPARSLGPVPNPFLAQK